MNSGSSGTFHRKLNEFLDLKTLQKAGAINYSELPGDTVISSLEYDSRNVKPGSVYFALPGLHADGHDFIPDAVNKGALVIIHERELPEYGVIPEKTVFIRVKNSRLAMSPIADSFYDHPSGKMGIIGVTGTEGKSTTVYFIYQLLKEILKPLGKKAGFISTVMRGDGLADHWNSEHQTTPEAPIIHRLLEEMRRNGAEYAVLESSSHGLSKKTNRLGDVEFDVGVVTTVTHEHLEFHGSWEQYRSDKAELFRSLDASKQIKQGRAGDLSLPSFGVVNADDPSADYFTAATGQKTYSFSTQGAAADLSTRLIESSNDGNSYEVLISSTGKTLIFHDRLTGAFNAGNVLAAVLVVSALLSIEIESIIPLIPGLKPVRGRMTSVCRGQPFELLVDYAHTPSSFRTILPLLKSRLRCSAGRLICVFGSAGERDTEKRKLQGEIAALYSDIIILTDEDPRGEDPLTILEEIAQGCETAKVRGEALFLIPDRPKALRKAISLARPGDLVLLLGKGHENSIIYASGPVSYDEISEAEAALAEAGYSE